MGLYHSCSCVQWNVHCLRRFICYWQQNSQTNQPYNLTELLVKIKLESSIVSARRFGRVQVHLHLERHPRPVQCATFSNILLRFDFESEIFLFLFEVAIWKTILMLNLWIWWSVTLLWNVGWPRCSRSWVFPHSSWWAIFSSALSSALKVSFGGGLLPPCIGLFGQY